MMLLVGLGNPGPQYAGNRHNIGFMAVDAIAAKHGFGPPKARFKALTMEGFVGGVRTLILKPTTFMNLSGEAVGEASRYLKIPVENIVVFHDELDLAPGKLRMKQGAAMPVTTGCGRSMRISGPSIAAPASASVTRATARRCWPGC